MERALVGFDLIATARFLHEGVVHGNEKVLLPPKIQMKQRLHLIITASAASVLTFSALAQPSANTETDHPDYSRQNMPHGRRADRLNGAAKASDVIGLVVKNYKDEKLGRVEELAVDLESGRIVQVILSSGGFLGIGETLIAVPPSALHYDATNKVVHLNSDAAKLKDAPKFDDAKWAEYSDSEHLSAVYTYHGEESAFRFVHKSDAAAAADAAAVKVGRDAGGAWDKDRVRSRSLFMIPTERLSHLQKAGKLMGTSVKNLQDEKLGKVENLLIDLSSGRVVAVVISSGGFIGIGDELSAVPPNALRFSSDRAALQLDASKEMLAASPHFKANEWPDFSQPDYAGGIYRAYKVEPYFTTNLTADADNTGRNIRDRGSRNLTPLDQGNSQADIDTTAQIRKGIIAGKNMSVNAKNVKVITNKGRVTLRGPVNTAEEKRLIAEIAGNIALVDNVDNQLEVK